MAYTIRLAQHDRDTVMALAAELKSKLVTDGRFTAMLEDGPRLGDIVLRTVRLTTPKIYCGQHAGPCDLPRQFEQPKRRRRLLEWQDWIELHGLVNDVLDARGLAADVWSTPPDTRVDKGRKLWMRRGSLRRHRWDYEEMMIGRGPWTQYVVDHGSPSQFLPEEAQS